MTLKRALGVVLPCLLLLTSCSKAQPLPLPIAIEQPLPAHLLLESPVPLWRGSSNADLVDYIFELKAALAACNADKAALNAAQKKD